MVKQIAALVAVLGVTGTGIVRAQTAFTPARVTAAKPPALPSPQTVGWVTEAIEVAVDEGGRPTKMATLETTGGSSLLAAAVAGWQFDPARINSESVGAHVLVEGFFNPPISVNAPTIGTPPAAVAPRSAGVPVPQSTSIPQYPANVIADGVVVVELLVDTDGKIASSRVVDSAPGFDTVALDAAKQWTFRPAERNRQPVQAYVYLVFGFRRPVV